MKPILSSSSKIYTDLSIGELVRHAILRKEGKLSSTQSLVVQTGTRTGRSPKDRFIVQDDLTRDTVAWGTTNQPIHPEVFRALWQKAENYLTNKDVFISHLQVCADPKYSVSIKVITEKAWHNLFARHLFIRPETSYISNEMFWTILNVPGLQTNPVEDKTHSEVAVLINILQRRILLCGMEYAGEMKKAMFSALNYFLPNMDVLPMHCSANVGECGDVALFFGLSGTGKTTLSADPERYLMGDDEHGWSSKSVFNFEGGCYAKCINLSQEREPVIWNAIRFGTIMENVVINNETKEPLFDDATLTQNTRAAYPLDFISKRIKENRAGLPSAVIFLTCDLYGVLPPIALLTKEQAAYHFLSGYTALVGSTEVDSNTTIQPTFSTCFGAPFFPRPPSVYANLLMKRIDEANCQVYLINTGWTGGAYGEGGKRFTIPTTRAIVRSALLGELRSGECEIMPGFNITIPKQVSNVDTKILNPRKTWSDSKAYNVRLNELIDKFIENFKRFNVSQTVLNAGPTKLKCSL